MRCAIYARVSSQKQREKHTIASQLSTLPAYVASQGWTLAETYVDDGHTAKAGHLDERDGLARLLADAARGHFDAVAVVDLDRLTRSEDQTERGAILGAFQRAGIKIAVSSTGQVLDLASSVGDLMSSLGAYFAAEENRKRRERTKRGREEAARRGRPSSKVPWGYAFDRSTGRWGHDPVTAPLVREIFERAMAGDSAGMISVRMDQRDVPNPRGVRWYRARVYAILTAPAYRGEWRTSGVTIALPPIVDVDTWQAASDTMRSGKLRGLRRTRHVYLLEAIATCGLCGARIVIRDPRNGGKRSPYYTCGRRRERQRYGETCTLPLRRTSELDALVWADVAAYLAQPERVRRATARRQLEAGQEARTWLDDVRDWEARLARLTRSETGVLERHRRGIVSEAALDVELGRIATDRRALERQIATARAGGDAALLTVRRAGALSATLDDLRGRLSTATPEEQRELVRAVAVDGVSVGEDAITLHLGRAAGERRLAVAI